MFAYQSQSCTGYRRSTAGAHYLGECKAESETEAVRAALIKGDKDYNVFTHENGRITDQNGTTTYEPGDTRARSGDWVYTVTEEGDELTPYEEKAIELNPYA